MDEQLDNSGGEQPLGRDQIEAAIAKTHGSDLLAPDDAPETILYDADRDQRIPFLMEEDGVSHEVFYILGPQKDAVLIEYERQIEQRVMAADEAETGVRDAMEQSDKTFEADLWLFEDRLVAVDGFGEPGEAIPDNWRELIGSDADKSAVIETAYLAADIAPAAPAKRGTVRGWKKSSDASTIPLRALFEGYQLLLHHQRAEAPTADHISAFKSIMKRSWLVGGTRMGTGEALVPPKGQRLGALYDHIGYTATGYKGRVPLHHKRRVVIHDLSRHVNAVTKK